MSKGATIYLTRGQLEAGWWTIDNKIIDIRNRSWRYQHISVQRLTALRHLRKKLRKKLYETWV